jgi:putative nucleotidyltransferase with HDIG domain
VQAFLIKFRQIHEEVGTQTAAFITACVVSAVAVGLVLSLHRATVGDLWAVAGLAGVAAVSERGRVSLGGKMEISISLLPALFAAVLFGPLPAMIVFASSMLGKANTPLPARILYMATRALTGAATGVVASEVSRLGDHGVGSIVAAAAAAAPVAEFVDMGFSAVIYSVRGHGSVLEPCRTYLPVVTASAPFYMPVVALLVVAYEQLSPITLPLFFIPALAAQRWFVLYQEQRRLATDLGLANAQLERANLSFASALVATLDARDQYTAGHSAAVAVYARDIAARLGLSEEEQRVAHLAGLVHDLGKIGLPAGLLEKPGALTLDERRQMEQHPVIGQRILANVETYAEIASAVRHHHERVDGHGYPDGLAGDEIPMLARIIAVADAYDAMTSDRPYRDAMPSRVARLRLAQAVGSQFDTSIVAAFEAILASASEAYRDGDGETFRLAAPTALSTGARTRTAVREMTGLYVSAQ